MTDKNPPKRVRRVREWVVRDGELMRREDADLLDFSDREAMRKRRIDEVAERHEREYWYFPAEPDDEAIAALTPEEETFMRDRLKEILELAAHLPPRPSTRLGELPSEIGEAADEAKAWRDAGCPNAVPLDGKRRFWFGKRLAGGAIVVLNSVRYELTVFLTEPDCATDPLSWVFYEVIRMRLAAEKPVKLVYRTGWS